MAPADRSLNEYGMTAMQALTFTTPPPTPGAEALRHEVRDFLAAELRDRPAAARAESWSGNDPAFSRKMGQRGWIGRHSGCVS